MRIPPVWGQKQVPRENMSLSSLHRPESPDGLTTLQGHLTEADVPLLDADEETSTAFAPLTIFTFNFYFKHKERVVETRVINYQGNLWVNNPSSVRNEPGAQHALTETSLSPCGAQRGREPPRLPVTVTERRPLPGSLCREAGREGGTPPRSAPPTPAASP